jgi:hypothetical protein
MKFKIALSLIAVALLPACSTTKTASNTGDAKSSRYANNSVAEAVPPAEGPTTDIPSEGPHDVIANPAYMPSPLLRTSAAGGP